MAGKLLYRQSPLDDYVLSSAPKWLDSATDEFCDATEFSDDTMLSLVSRMLMSDAHGYIGFFFHSHYNPQCFPAV